jgi:hypothetical protein
MTRLWESGIERVVAGVTSLGEVSRVLDIPLPPMTEALVRRAREALPAQPSPRLTAALDDFELVDP